LFRLDSPRAILLTGAFGSGKSSVTAEIADLVEGKLPYAAIDLDWLAWFDAMDGSPEHELGDVGLKNLSDVVHNYLDAGVRLFLIADAVRDAAELALLQPALPMPVTVVRLEVPIEEIEARLGADATTGRQDDLRRAREWIAAGRGTGFEDLVVDNDRPIREVALEIIERVSSAWA
jgi:chloramphenicol 3-O-phosphotransferase